MGYSSMLSELMEIQRSIEQLRSIVDGERAMERLIASGPRAIPYLESFLLSEPPRSIAIPRCRAVHALGELGGCSTLISYFRSYKLPGNPQVLFAEDSVRSAAALELIRYPSEQIFEVLLDAARQRVTGGIISAISKFHHPKTVPLLFEVLEDDLCREEAKASLRQMPAASREYAVLCVRGQTATHLLGVAAIRRCRATLELLGEFGISADEWQDVQQFLSDEDPDIVIAAAALGLRFGPAADEEKVVNALLRIADRIHWLQEKRITELLDAHPQVAFASAQLVAEKLRSRGKRSEWIKPIWRILQHVLNKCSAAQPKTFK